MPALALTPGNDFDLLREGTTPGQYALLCSGTTLEHELSVEFDQSLERDCDAPTALSQMIKTPKNLVEGITFSGRSNKVAFNTLRADALAGTARNFQILVRGNGASGGGTYIGACFVARLSRAKADGATVTFSCSLIVAVPPMTFTAAV